MNVADALSNRDRATSLIERVHERATRFFESADGGGEFDEDQWVRDGGGGGVTRVLTNGRTFEKAGVNRSAVFGTLSSAAAARLGGRIDVSAPHEFFATGLSIVAHPRNPHIPTVHLNVRYFEVTSPEGEVHDAWFGGGTDLTPMFPEPSDARHFHSALRRICDKHDARFYPQFKRQCDLYFRNEHRSGEARGVGGIFFDHLRPGDSEFGHDADQLFAFIEDVARSLEVTYGPMVETRRNNSWDEADRALQLERRGRYVEFNLLHDRGTVFGLQTGARVESVLMSLPPIAAWEYSADSRSSPMRDALVAMLAPRDWASQE